jgi:hypothetical protein
MDWPGICHAFAQCRIPSDGFRRLRGVRDVVETVGAVDGRHYAALVCRWAPEWLLSPDVASVDSWGDPLTWPRLLLGTPRSFSPTTLRYLATALWMERQGLFDGNPAIVEIGVGFGGLAAMNQIIGGHRTHMVDLPDVEECAKKFLSQLGLDETVVERKELDAYPNRVVISNYAFSELESGVQDIYLNKYLIGSTHGVIVSNAAIFATSIGGRNDDQLVGWLRDAGISAYIDEANDLRSPGDALCGVRMIRW